MKKAKVLNIVKSFKWNMEKEEEKGDRKTFYACITLILGGFFSFAIAGFQTTIKAVFLLFILCYLYLGLVKVLQFLRKQTDEGNAWLKIKVHYLHAIFFYHLFFPNSDYFGLRGFYESLRNAPLAFFLEPLFLCFIMNSIIKLRSHSTLSTKLVRTDEVPSDA